MNQRRMINTSLWQDEEFALLSDSARLLFIGMFSIADDDGRLRANPLYLKAQIFMYDAKKTESVISQLLLEIEKTMRSIKLYQVGGKQYAEFQKWETYQSIRSDRKRESEIPSSNECKDVDNQLTTKCQPTDNQLTTTRQPNVRIKEMNRNEMKLSEEKENIKEKKYSSIHDLSESDVLEIANQYKVSTAFVESKIDDMVNWHESTGKVRKNWKATLKNWVKRDALERIDRARSSSNKRALDFSNL